MQIGTSPVDARRKESTRRNQRGQLVTCLSDVDRRLGFEVASIVDPSLDNGGLKASVVRLNATDRIIK